MNLDVPYVCPASCFIPFTSYRFLMLFYGHALLELLSWQFSFATTCRIVVYQLNESVRATLFFFQIPPLSFLFFYCHVWLAVILNRFVLSIFLICFGYFVYFTVLGNTMFILGASRVGWYNARVTNSRVLLVSKLILKFFCSIIYSILYFV